MPVTEQTRRIIWGMFAGRCAICKSILIEEEQIVGKRKILTGQVAHIVGEKTDAARGISSTSKDERNDPDNLILLCTRHHKIVDDDEATYTVEMLHQIRIEHLEWLAKNLSNTEEVLSKYSMVNYVNIPRMSQICSSYGYPTDLFDEFLIENKPLHRYGFNSNKAILLATRLMDKMQLKLIDSTDRMKITKQSIGMPCFLENKRFRTKNFLEYFESNKDLSGIRERDPYIYTDVEGCRFFISIDPRWVTTKSAAHDFSSGQVNLTCVFIIKDIDFEAMHIYGTPIIIGTLAAHSFMDAIESGADNVSIGPRGRLIPHE